MFNDRYGLTAAVLAGRKTMTRRVIRQLVDIKDPELSEWGIDDNGRAYICLDEGGRHTTDIFPTYQIGKRVAVAQSYESIVNEEPDNDFGNYFYKQFRYQPGWTNKMFVSTDLMPHSICINDIKVERLQDISDEDCLKEGITTITEGKREPGNGYGWDTHCAAYDRDTFFTPRAAFAALIDLINGRGTWESNPWVFSYEFKLIR